jgi:hypothetical protein
MTAGRKDTVLQRLKSLGGRHFQLKRWTSPNPEWTHDHCCGCRADICNAADDDFHEGYVTIGANGDEWVCPKCFDLYHLVLRFKVREPSAH